MADFDCIFLRRHLRDAVLCPASDHVHVFTCRVVFAKEAAGAVVDRADEVVLGVSHGDPVGCSLWRGE